MKQEPKKKFDREFFVKAGRRGGYRSLEEKTKKGTVETDLERARAIRAAKKTLNPLDNINEGDMVDVQTEPDTKEH